MILKDVDLNEPLTRYINSKRHFKSTKNIVLSATFQPRNGTVSIFRIQGWSLKEIWSKGEEVMKNRKASLKGRADFIWDLMKNTGLKIEPDSLPSRHTNITGFPDEKERVDELALFLSQNSEFHPFTPVE